jgi:hypothetical protein
MFYSELNKLVNPTTISDLNKVISGFNFNQDKFGLQYKQITNFFNSPIYKTINNSKVLFGNHSDLVNTIKAFNDAVHVNNDIFQASKLYNQFIGSQNIFQTGNELFSNLTNVNKVCNAFTSSGIFDAISNISKTMSVLQAVKRLDILFPFVEPDDINVTISDEDTISVNGENILGTDIIEIAKEFNTFPIGSSNIEQIIGKITSNIGKFFINILKFIIIDTLFSPIFEDIFDVIRENTGIYIILDKIDIKGWVDELKRSNSEEIIIEKEE